MFCCAWSSPLCAGFSLWQLLLQHRLGAHRLQRLGHIGSAVAPHRLSCPPCCRKGDPSQGVNVGSCLTLRNELSEEIHVLTKQEILLGRVPRWRAVGWGSQGGLLPLMWLPVLGFFDGISLRVVFSQSLWFTQPRRILGGGRTRGVSFWPWPNSSSWWRLISSVFLTRPSCRKVSDAGGYQVPGQGGRFPSACFP